jgi:hypothetical protein
MAYPYDLVSRDAARALTDYSSEFDAALESVDPASEWAKQFAFYNSSRAIRTVYPIPVSAAKYVERKGDDAMRSLNHRSIAMSPKTWVDGIHEFARVLEAPDFIGWQGEPARIAREAKRHANNLVAGILQANPNLGFYRDLELGTGSNIPLFSASHKVNIFDDALGTFTNLVNGGGADFAGAVISTGMMSAVFTQMRSRKGPNGQPMQIKPTHMIVHPQYEQAAKDFLESDLMRYDFLKTPGGGAGDNHQQTSNNRYKNIVQLVVADELAVQQGAAAVDADLIYFVDATSGAKPWIVQDGGNVETVEFDKNSDYYKRTGKVGFTHVLELAAAAALPHAITRVNLTP